MSLLRVVLFLLLSLAVEAGLAGIWPSSQHYVRLLLVPVVLYGLSVSQRAGMLVGCAAGLLRDAWFETEAFGVGGVKWTLAGWALGAVNARMDLNNPTGRFLSGVVVVVGDAVLDPLLRRLLDQPVLAPGPVELLARALLTGLLAASVGSIVDPGRTAHQRRRTP